MDEALQLKRSLPEEETPAFSHATNLDGPVHYLEIPARSVLNRVKAMMPMNWTINPYRGCRHACVYCYARPTHTYYNLNAGADFHTRIFVKINAPEVLRKELSRPGWKGESICLGSATDPYQPGERRYRLTRRLLEVLCDFSNPVDIITKSHLVLDDLDVLVELNRRTRGRVAVNMSLTTLDETKARLIDPGAPSPRKRLEAIARLAGAGIKTRLFIMPLLPGITDQPEELEALVEAGYKAGAHSATADALRIARGLEDYFYGFLDKHYPHLRPRYERLYGHGRRTMAVDAYRDALKRKMAELRAMYEPERRLSETYEEQALNRVLEHPARLQAALEAAEERASRPVPKLRPSGRVQVYQPAPTTVQGLEQASFNF